VPVQLADQFAAVPVAEVQSDVAGVELEHVPAEVVPGGGVEVDVAAIVSASAATATTAVVITGAQIKDGSIQVKDLSRKARIALRGQRGPRGFAGLDGAPGATGATGATGARGADGGFDPNKVTLRQDEQKSIPAGALETLTATCASGERAISGGWIGATGATFTALPLPASGTYQVTIENYEPYAFTASVYAVCAAR
jgi:hypothetical protein